MTRTSLERVRYFPKQLMTAEDMRVEQDYFVERHRRHNRILHGWGISCGLEVKPAPTTEHPWRVIVCPGSACAATGDEIEVPCAVPFDLLQPSAQDPECLPCPCPPEASSPSVGGLPTTVHIAIRYLCQPVRPVRTGHANCNCGQNGCETSRLRDDFRLTVLTKIEDDSPYSESAISKETKWIQEFRKILESKATPFDLPVRPCMSATYPWVILASADLASTDPKLTLRTTLRRALVSSDVLLGLHQT